MYFTELPGYSYLNKQTIKTIKKQIFQLHTAPSLRNTTGQPKINGAPESTVVKPANPAVF